MQGPTWSPSACGRCGRVRCVPCRSQSNRMDVAHYHTDRLGRAGLRAAAVVCPTLGYRGLAPNTQRRLQDRGTTTGILRSAEAFAQRLCGDCLAYPVCAHALASDNPMYRPALSWLPTSGKPCTAASIAPRIHQPHLHHCDRPCAGSGALGGFLGRTGDGEPGVQTIWTGFHELIALTDMYRIMNSDKSRKSKQAKIVGND